MKPSSELSRVQRAATERRALGQEYRTAVLEARSAGYSLAQIATVAGVSRQAIQQVKREGDQ